MATIATETTSDAAPEGGAAELSTFLGVDGMPDGKGGGDGPGGSDGKNSSESVQATGQETSEAAASAAAADETDHRIAGAEAHERFKERQAKREAKAEAQQSRDDQRAWMNAAIRRIEERRDAPPVAAPEVREARQLLDSPNEVFEQTNQQMRGEIAELRQAMAYQQQQQNDALYQQQQTAQQQQAAQQAHQQNMAEIENDMNEWEAAEGDFLGEGGVLEGWQQAQTVLLKAEGFADAQISSLLLGAINRFRAQGAEQGINGMHLLENHAAAIGVVIGEEVVAQPAAEAPAPAAVPAAVPAVQSPGMVGSIGSAAQGVPGNGAPMRTPEEYIADGINGRQLADMMIARHGPDNIEALKEELLTMNSLDGAWGGPAARN